MTMTLREPTRTSATTTETAAPSGMRRRDEIAFVVFSSWTIGGLFLDGWAHRQGKPETFFTPWHGVLYSGFLAGMLFAIYDRWRSARRGDPAPPTDRLVVAGGLVFAGAGVGDMVWHTIFGIEEGLAALLSPTHLALMVAGLLLTTSPLRTDWNERSALDNRFRRLAPQVVAVALSTALVAFFVMFANPFVPNGSDLGGDAKAAFDAIAILLTNALIVAPLLWLAARAALPRGAALLYVAVVIGLMLSLDAFDQWPFIMAAIAGGLAGEATRRFALTDRPGGIAVFGAAVCGAIWMTYNLVAATRSELPTDVELWAGPLVLAMLTPVGLAYLAARSALRS